MTRLYSISEKRQVHLDRFDDAPLHYTRGGNRPMRPDWLKITYTANYVSIEIRGRYTDGRQLGEHVVRRWNTERAPTPDWILELVEKYRPDRELVWEVHP